MKSILCIVSAFVLTTWIIPAAVAKMTEPDYVLVNTRVAPIKIRLIQSDGETAEKTLESGQQLDLKSIRHIIVQWNGEEREYLLPSILLIHRKKGETVIPPVTMMSKGKWRIIVNEGTRLGISFVDGKHAYKPILDFSRPPVLFPLRPRLPNESLADYEAALAELEKRALTQR